MSISKLDLYNRSLLHLGERKLASLTENREPRRVLDDVYPGAIDYTLGQGYWKFAIRTAKIVVDPNVTPTFGYSQAYQKPLDLVRTYKISSEEFMNVPLLQYNEEGSHWFSDSGNEIYVAYVSNDAAYGNDLSRWTEPFIRYFTLHLATEIVDRLAPTGNDNKLEAKKAQALDDALTKDAMEGPTAFLPAGTWLSSRIGYGRGGRRDRGPRGRFHG